jgi:hypothetical protein
MAAKGCEMILITIDPGNTTGVAIFIKKQLSGAAYLEGNAFAQAQELMKICNVFSGNKVEFEKAVIEIPRVYSQKQWKGDPNDLIKVAMLAGFFGEVLSFYYAKPHDQIEFIHPSTWKGQRPKDLDNQLTMGLLQGSELAVMHKVKLPKSRMHNVIDAVGIGLYTVQRR